MNAAKLQSKEEKSTGNTRTEARRARRAKVMHTSLKTTNHMSKRPHHAVMGARASEKLETDEARRYFDSLIAPENGSAQFPDLSDFPTIPVSSRFQFAVSTHTQATSLGQFSVVTLGPNLLDFYQQPTAIASDGTITWGADQTHPLYNTYYANFAAYRPISMAVRVINSSNYNIKQGLLYMDLCSPLLPSQVNSGAQRQIPYLYTIPSSPTVSVGSFANEYVEDEPRLLWLPVKLNSFEFIPIDANPDSGNYISQTSEVPFLAVQIDHQTTDTTKVQNVTLEVFFNFEAIPLYAFQSLFDPRPCIGSEDKNSQVFLENQDALYSTIASTVDKAEQYWGVFERASRVAAAAGSFFGWGSTSHNELSLRNSLGIQSGCLETAKALKRSIVQILHDLKLDDIPTVLCDEKDLEDAFNDLLKSLKFLKRYDLNHMDFESNYCNNGPWKRTLTSVSIHDPKSVIKSLDFTDDLSFSPAKSSGKPSGQTTPAKKFR